MAKEICYEKVVEVVKVLQAEKIDITIRNIQERLGGGKADIIHNYLYRWRKITPILDSLPEQHEILLNYIKKELLYLQIKSGGEALWRWECVEKEAADLAKMVVELEMENERLRAKLVKLGVNP